MNRIQRFISPAFAGCLAAKGTTVDLNKLETDPEAYLNGLSFDHELKVPEPVKKEEEQIPEEQERVLILVLRESANINDWVANLTVVGNLSLEGKVHQGFLSRAQTIPLKPLINYLNKSTRNKLIITGFSQGSAVGELVTLRLLKSPAFSPSWIRDDQLFFIGFGCPLIGDKNLSLSIISAAAEVKRWNDLFYHIVNQSDIVPRLLMLCNRDSAHPWLKTLIEGKILKDDKMNSVVDIFKAALDILLPEYDATHGHWIFLERKDGLIHHIALDATKDQEEVRTRLFWKGVSTVDVQQHNPINYLTSLSTCSLILADKARQLVRQKQFLAPTILASSAKFYPNNKQAFIFISGENVHLINRVVADEFFSENVKLASFNEIVDQLVVKISNIDGYQFSKLKSINLRLFTPYAKKELIENVTDINEFGINHKSHIPITVLLQIASLHEMMFFESDNPEQKTELSLMDTILNIPGNQDALVKFNQSEFVIVARVFAWINLNGHLFPNKIFESYTEGLTGFMAYLKSTWKDKDYQKLESLVNNAKTQNVDIDYFLQLPAEKTIEYMTNNLPPLIGFQFLIERFHGIRKRVIDSNVTIPPSITSYFLTLQPVIFLTAIQISKGSFPVVHNVNFPWYKKIFKYTVGAAIRAVFNPNFMSDKYVRHIELDYQARVTRIYEMIQRVPSSSFSEMESAVVSYVEANTVEKKENSRDKMFPKEFTQLDVQNVCDFFPTIRRFNALRKLIKDRLLLSFIGPQKSGKSTVISRMWELSTGAAADVNTSEPTAYFAYNSIGHKIDEIPILDWPALTDKDKNRTEMQKLVLPFASACAIVVTVQNANESPVFDILRFVNDEMDCSYVILLNKVDVLYQEIKNDVVSRKNNTNDLAQLLQESQTTPDERQEAWDRFWSRVTTFIGEITSKYPKSKGKIFPTCYSNESLRFLLKEKANMSKYDLNSNIPDDFEVEERVVYAWHGTKKIFAHLLSDSIPDHLKNIWETLMKRTISESQAQNVRKEHPQPPDTSSL